MTKMIKMRQTMNTKYFLLALGLCAFSVPAVQANDRDITEAEIQQYYTDMYFLESSIINTDDIELQDKQREEIAKELSSLYTDDAIIKLYDVRMTEKLKRLPVINAKFDKYAYENVMEVESKLKNLNATFDIKNIDYKGQHAVVDINTIYTSQYDATSHEDIVKISADVISKSMCKNHMKIDYDDRPRIYHQDCKSRTYISNIDLDVPEYMEDAAGRAEVKLDQDVVFKR